MIEQNIFVNLKQSFPGFPGTRVISPKPVSFETSTSIASSQRSSVRRMNQHLGAPMAIRAAVKQTALTPTARFMQTHPVNQINAVLRQYRATDKDMALFKEIAAHEDEGFLGYQAGSSTVRLFQDMIAILVKDVLQIPVKDDFVFTRLPGDPTFHYENASDFLKEMGRNIPPSNWDNQPQIRQHILSLNMNLYQSYDAPWDLTPRYYLENATWTQANVRELIKPLFASLGVDGQTVDRIWSQALNLLPHNRGYILQFFDRSNEYAFTKEHAYISQSGGKPHPAYRNHEILFDPSATNFPQIRLVMSNESTLNPYSSLEIKRYDGMTDSEKQAYESSLRSLLKGLSFDQAKVEGIRLNLLNLWTA